MRRDLAHQAIQSAEGRGLIDHRRNVAVRHFRNFSSRLNEVTFPRICGCAVLPLDATGMFAGSCRGQNMSIPG